MSEIHTSNFAQLANLTIEGSKSGEAVIPL